MDDQLGCRQRAADQTDARGSPPVVSHRWTQLHAVLHACECRALHTPFQFSLLAVLLLLATSYVTFQPSYDTNDDVFMTMIAAGQGFCPAADEHLIFTNVIIGKSLKRLYTVWPWIPWYGCYLLLVHFLAQVAVLYCALATHPQSETSRRDSIGRRFALYLVYFGVVELLFLNTLQFTTTAFLAAQAGIFLLLFAARRRVHGPDAAATLPLCAAVSLLVVAGLIRLDSLAMALLVASPLGLYLLCQGSRRALVPVGLAAGLATALTVLAIGYDRVSYEHDPNWSGFFRYNQLRVKFNDYQWTSYTPRTADVFSAVGWTKNDYEMIAHWFFDDPLLYSEAHLRFILEAHPWKIERLTLGFLWQFCRGLPRDRSIWAVVLVLPFFLVSVDRGRHARWSVLSCAIVAVALVAILTWNSKLLPARVYFPLLSFPLSVALLFPAGRASPSSPRFDRETTRALQPRHGLSAWRARPSLSRAVVVLLVVGVVMGVYHQGRRSVRVYKARRDLENFLAELHPDGRHLYVCWESAMPFELISPMSNLLSWSQMPLVNLVWTQRTPWQEEIKRRFGATNLAEAMCGRDDVVLVATPAHRSMFATFAREHCQANLEFVPSIASGEKLVAGRFQRRKPPEEAVRHRADEVRQ